MLCYWQEDGGSLLMTSFMAITEQRHKVPKLSERIFASFVFFDVKNKFLRFLLFDLRSRLLTLGIA